MSGEEQYAVANAGILADTNVLGQGDVGFEINIEGHQLDILVDYYSLVSDVGDV